MAFTDASWSYAAEPDPQRPKHGYVSSTPKARLTLKVSTRTSSNATAYLLNTDNPRQPVRAQLMYLSASTGMGRAVVSCTGDCSCPETYIDGHEGDEAAPAQLRLHDFLVTQGDDCLVSVVVMPDSSSGGHRVKVAGLVVEEQLGVMEGLRSAAGVNWVADAA